MQEHAKLTDPAIPIGKRALPQFRKQVRERIDRIAHRAPAKDAPDSNAILFVSFFIFISLHRKPIAAEAGLSRRCRTVIE
jgi:hypothetical protein